MASYSSAIGTVTDAIVTSNISVSHTLTGFTSEDFVYLDFNLTMTQSVKYHGDVIRSGNDLIIKMVNNITDIVLSTTTIKGVYGLDGLDFVSYLFTRDGGLPDDDGPQSVAILKNFTSSRLVSTQELSDLNWDESFVVGTNYAETLYGAIDAFNDFFDNAGDDTVYGGDDGNNFNVGSGNDTFTGGDKDDQYQFDHLSSFTKGSTNYTKTITDFDASDGDIIDLDTIAFNHKMKFSAVRDSSNWKRGDIVFEVHGSDGWLLGNTDKDAAAEIKIILTGVTEFDANLSLDLNL